MRKFLVMAWIIPSALMVGAQNTSIVDCKDYIKAHKKTVDYKDLPEKGKKHSMHYSVQVVAKEISKSTNVTINLAITHDKVFYLSSYMDLFMDDDKLITVNHLTKEITIKNSIKSNYIALQQGNKINQALDSMLEMSIVVSCMDNVQNSERKEINLALSPADAEKTGVSLYGYSFDSKKNQIMSGWVKYHKKHPLSTMKFEYHSIKFNQKDDSKPIEKLVFSRKMTETRYKGYKIINNYTS